MAEKKCVEYDLMGRCTKWKLDPDGTPVIEVDKSVKGCEEVIKRLKEQKLRIRIPAPDD